MGVGNSFSLGLFIKPRWTLWYLLSLIFWRLAIQLLSGVISPFALVVLSFVLGVASGFVPFGAVLSLQRSFTFAPFFMIGFYCRQNNIDLHKVKRIHPLTSLAVLGIILFCVSRTDFPVVDFVRGKYPFSYFKNYSLWLLPLYRIGMYLVSMISIISVMALIPEKQSWISREGENTLFYYLYHSLVILALFTLGRFSLPSSLVACLIYAAFVTVVIWGLIKIPFFKVLPKLFTHVISAKNNKPVNIA